MKKGLIVLASLFFFPAVVYGHVCNDVFQFLKDNLAVKVDIQDDQLHINESAKFRVYMLNTMFMDLGNIQLDVITDEFDVTVTPSEGWNGYPCLPTVVDQPMWACDGGFAPSPNRVKGKKEHFEVELKRKPDTPTGKYKIGLRLFGVPQDEGLSPDMQGGEVMTIGNINEVITVMAVPKPSEQIEVDGNVSASEWKDALLCTSMYLYKPKSMIQHKENVKSDVQTRFRFTHEEDKLFCLVDFLTPSKSDIAKLYFARDRDSIPTVITADLQQQKAVVSGREDEAIRVAVKENKMELELPLDMVDLKDMNTFYMNMSRDYDNKTTYWRGNSRSILEPMVYEKIELQ